MHSASRRAFLSATAQGRAPARVLENCLATRGIDCQLCRDACDMHALAFLPQRGAPARPVIDPDLCTACNACVGLCPAQALQPGTPAP